MKKARANSKSSGETASVTPGDACAPPLASGAILLPSEQAAPQPVHLPLTQLPSQYAPPTCTWPPKAGSARAASKTNRSTNRLIILSSIQNELIARLTERAEIAYTLRRLDEVEAVSRQLEEIHAPIASFWKGLAAQRLGAGNLDHAQRLLEQAASSAPRNYQARALLVLGSVAKYKGDQRAEAEFYRQAMNLNASDLYAQVEGHRAVAILRAIEGDHKQAIALLERTLPVAHRYRARSPYIYLQALNSLAVEYQSVDRLREAFELARIATASPLASAYPEWKETRAEIEQEIQQRERASVVIVVPTRQTERWPQRRVIISFQIVGLRVRRRVIKPTIGRAPVFRSMVERVATVAPIHAPPFSL